MKHLRQTLTNHFLKKTFAFSILFGWGQLHAQVVVSGYGAPASPMNVGGQQSIFKVKIMGSAVACAGPKTLTVTLPPGYVFVSGSASRTAGSGIVTQVSAAANFAILSLSGIPAAPDSTVISYRVYAGCGVIGSTATNDVDYILNSCIGTSSISSNAFNSLNAQLNILSISNNAYTGIVGDVYSRVITISNDGFGAIDTLYLDDISGKGLSITGASVSSGTFTRTKTVSGTDTLYRYKIVSPTANGFLNSGEQITITETVKIVACNNLSSSFDAWYGPNGVKCNGVNNTSTAGASINDALQPNLKVISDAKYNTCRNLPTTSRIKFVNTGASVLKKAIIHVNQQGYIDDTNPSDWTGALYQQGFDPASFRYKMGENGTSLSISIDSSAYFTQASCINATKPYSAYLTLPDIAAGDTLILSFNEHICCLSGCNYDIWFPWPGLEVSYSFKNDCGTEVNSNNPQVMRWAASTIMTVNADLPMTMAPGTDYSFNYEITNSGLYDFIYLPGSEVTFQVTLPARVEFAGTAADLTAISRDGSSYGVPSSFNYNSATRTLTVSYIMNATMIDNLQRLKIRINKLRANCALPAGSNEAQFNIFVRQAGCSGCNTQYVCNNTQVDVYCPTACPNGGLTVVDVSCRRTNYGLPDNNNDGLPDASGSLDFSKVKTNYVIYGDTLEMKYTGKILVSGGSPFKYGYLNSDLSARSADYTPVNVVVDIYHSGSLTVHCTNLMPVISGSKFKLDFSIDKLSGFLASYGQYSNNDSIVIKSYYKVTGGMSSWESFSEPIKVTNEWYIARIVNPSNASDKFYCNVINSRFRQLAVVTPDWRNTPLQSAGCGEVRADFSYYLGIGYSQYNGGNNFVNEYRPINMYDTLYFTMPSGYSFVRAEFEYGCTRGTLVSDYLWETLAPVNPAAPTLTFDLKRLYTANGGTWPVSDEGNYVYGMITLAPSCTSPAEATSNMEFIQKNVPGFTPFRNTMAGPVVFEYDRPDLSLTSSSATKTVNTNTVDWEVQLTNISKTADASNGWIAKDGVSGVTITSVQLLSGPGGTVTGTISPAGGIYQLGSFNSLQNKFYKITATYLSCIKDSINLSYGWNCPAYPANISAALCKQSLKLYVIPQPANLQLSILNEPVPGTYQLCSRLDYEVKVINPALGNARQLRVVAQLPASGGVAYIAGSYQLAVSSGAYTAISDANVAIAGNTLTFTIPITSISNLVSTDSFKLKIGLQTNSCNFVSGQDIRFTPLGTNPCGSNIVGTTQQSKKIRIAGAPTQSNIYSMQSDIKPVTVCGSGMAITDYHFRINNLGPSPTTVLDGFNIEPPAPWKLNTSSIVYVRNPAGASYTSTTGGIYNFATGTNLAVGDSIVFNASLYVPAVDVPSLSCGNSSPLKENATSTFSAVCSFNGVTCSTQEIVTTHEVTPITVNKPIYDIIYFIGALNTTFTHLSGAITLKHENSIYVAQNVTITAYKDVNNNGTYDAGDLLIGSQSLPVNSDAVQTSTFNIPNQLAGSSYCPIVVVATFDCACGRAEFPYSCNNVLLPVRFTSQKTKLQGCSVLLNWTYETNNASVEKFVIERSDNGGISYAEIASKGAAENGFKDVDAPDGNLLYRIKAVTTTGSIFYSVVMPVSKNCDNGTDILTLYPNPVNQGAGTVVSMDAASSYSNAMLQVKDASGRNILVKNVKVNKGQNKFLIETSGILPGTYFVSLHADNSRHGIPVKLVVH